MMVSFCRWLPKLYSLTLKDGIALELLLLRTFFPFSSGIALALSELFRVLSIRKALYIFIIQEDIFILLSKYKMLHRNIAYELMLFLKI